MRSTSHHLQQLMASSSTSSITPELEHEIFLSFRGEDTRQNFTSHLYEAFRRKNIKTFIDDKLNRGEEISSSLLKAIEHSKISVIIFSKDYASSRWCLKELEEILKCKKAYDQIVIPVFHDVDPSNVRNQTGDFEKAFAELEKHVMVDSEMLTRWRTALRDAANLSGYDSKNYRKEAKLVKDIVNDVWKKLNYNSPIISSKNLIGLESSIEKIENLLCSKGVCKLGIWGIGGIGKTTLAGAIFKKISKQFKESYFIEKIREKSEKSGGLDYLCQKLRSAVLGDEHHHGFTFTRRSLISRKKVLIVFDDVTNLNQMQCLMAVFDDLDSYSRIIITTRDKHVLINCKVDYIHEMTKLSSDNAFQLFALHAFKGNSQTEDYIHLSSKVVGYAEGLPLALEVLGSFLFKRTKREWESALENLRISPHGEVQKVLKISYEGLDDKQKCVFLDIACFFKGYKRDFVEAILNARGLDTHIYINVLIERSLITTSYDAITMHDLLEEMGKEIVRQESIYNPGERSRLWDHEDIFSVLKNNTGTRAIRSICLDMSKVEELHLNPEAFNNMQNLRFLKFYGSEHEKKVPESDSSALRHILRFLKRENSNYGKKVHGFEKLKFDFYEIRHFCFHGYLDKSLPPNFNAKNLVALYMPESKVKKLWTGNQVLVNLKYINLSYSKHLCRIPDFSLMPNLESLSLADCTNLLEGFSSIHNLHKLVILDLEGCKSFDNLPISSNCQSLREVYLSNCSNLKKVPYLPNTVENLYLDGTAINEFPSIGHLFRLVSLSLRKCSRLERLPDSIRELKSLKYFYLSGCSKLDRLPDSICELKSLECLYLSGCSKLDRLPNDMGNLQTLKVLELEEISFAEIATFMTSLINLETLSLTRCKMQKRLGIPLVDLSVFQRMRDLRLIDCCIEVLPSNIGQLLSLERLSLERNNLEMLPESIKDLFNLKYFNLSNCQRLKYLPELPSSLRTMTAKNCVSLESISSLPATLLGPQALNGGVNFINCFKLKLDITDVLLNIERNANVWYRHKEIYPGLHFTSIRYPGCEIPKWFDLKSNESFIKCPKGWVNDNLVGFVWCAVISLQDYQQVGTVFVVFNPTVNGEGIPYSFPGMCFEVEKVIESDHVFILHEYDIWSVEKLTLSLNRQSDIGFVVHCSTWNGGAQSPVKKCGVTFLYAKDDDLRSYAKVDEI